MPAVIARQLRLAFALANASCSMGHLPVPASPEFGPDVPACLPSAPAYRNGSAQPVELIAALRQTLSAGTRAPESIFRTITEIARTLTGAEGVALALRTGGVVVCHARAGNFTPEIGSKLEAGSGISGECLRTSKALRCDDTQTDDRVDPELCRNLGIRSIAVVPLRGHDGTVGILEAFSPRPHAFATEQISLLKRLAEIAQAAYAPECRTQEPAPARNQEPSRSRIRPELFMPTAETPTAAIANEVRRTTKLIGWPSRYWIAGAAVLVLLMATVIWTTWREPDEDATSPQPTSQPQTVAGEAQIPAALAVIPWKPPAGRLLLRHESRPLLRNAAAIENAKVALPSLAARASNQNVSAEDSADPRQEKSDPTTSTVESPPTVAPVSNGESLAQLASAPVRLPELDASVSQGVSEATLLQQIQPIYPAEARSQRLEGAVVLELTVGADGSTQELRVISGPAILARAALDAVRQWRYRPAMLSGNAVVVRKQVTVIFKVP